MHFSNAFLKPAADEVGELTLADAASPSQWHSERDVRRGIERWQTKTFMYEAQLEAGVASAYAMEERMLEGSGLEFPEQRPKICDRMARRGSPAVAKLLSPSGYNDQRTVRWFRKFEELAPDTSQHILALPIWRYLDPTPLPYVEWHRIGFAYAKRTWRTRGPLIGSWMVKVKASDSEEEQEHYVPFTSESPSRVELQGLLGGLRRWEAQGDLVAYDLYLQEALKVASSGRPHPSLAPLQPEIAGFVTHVFGRVHVPHGRHNAEYQRERVRAARAAWRSRVLINRTQSGTSPSEFT